MWPEASFARLAELLRGGAAERGLKLAVVIDALPEDRPLVERINEHRAC